MSILKPDPDRQSPVYPFVQATMVIGKPAGGKNKKNVSKFALE